MTADEFHALAVRTRDAARLAERHGTSTHGYRRAAREACERMGEMAEQLADAEERAREADLDAQALSEDCRSCADLEHQLAEMARERDRIAGQLAKAYEKLRYCASADRSRRYEYGEERADGEPVPPGSGRWLTPGESALLFLEKASGEAPGILSTTWPDRDRLAAQLAEVTRERDAAREVASLRLRWEERTEEARDALRDLVAALSLDDGPRAKAIQHARAVLEEWGMR